MNIDPILALLSERIGLNAESLGPTAIARLVVKRMKETECQSPVAYAEKLGGDPHEFQSLVEGTVVVESWFFRGGELFSILARRIAQSAASSVRVLSAPCCTGEEPYSLAIELLEQGVPQTKWSILGVDLSAREIELARRGRYGDFSFRQIGPDLKARHFKEDQGQWQIGERVRNMVVFRQANLVSPSFLVDEPPFDLIFCRNVLIYLTPAARVKVLDNLLRLLSADGLLCMGHSEPLNDPRFEPIEPRQHFLYQRKAGPTPVAVPAPGLPQAPPPPPRAWARASRSPMQKPVAQRVDLLTVARQLADKGDYAGALGICVDLERSSTVSADVYQLMGVIYLNQGGRSEAEKCFQKALYLAPGHQESLIHLIHCSRERGDAKQAELYQQRLARLAVGGDASPLS